MDLPRSSNALNGVTITPIREPRSLHETPPKKRHILYAILLFILGVSVFWTADLRIPHDMGHYINRALNLYLGKGYLNIDGTIPDRGPGFPFLIAIAYWVGGVSLQTAYWTVRIFASFNPILVYLLGRKFYNERIGLAAAVMVLTSYGMDYWAYNHVDPVWPFFLLLSILLLVRSLERDKWLCSLLAGFCAGYGFLVKEAAILIWPLPVLLVLLVREYRTMSSYRMLVWFYIAVAAMVAPYIIFTVVKTEASGVLGWKYKTVIDGLLAPTSTKQSSFSYLRDFAQNHWNNLRQIYRGHGMSLSLHFVLAPLLVAGWFPVLFKAIRKEKTCIVMVASALCMFPMLYVIGAKGFRTGQALFFFYLSFLALSYSIFLVGDHLGSAAAKFKLLERPKHKDIIFLVASGLLIILQFFPVLDRNHFGLKFWKRSYVAGLLGLNQTAVLNGKYGPVSRKAAKWIETHIPKGTSIMIPWSGDGFPIYFYTHAQYPVIPAPLVSTLKEPNPDQIGRPVFLASLGTDDTPLNSVRGVGEQRMFNVIKQNKVQYFLVFRKFRFFTDYLRQNPSFELAWDLDGGAIQVYRIVEPLLESRKAGNRVIVTQRLVRYLSKIKNTNPAKYERYVNAFLKRGFGLNDEFIEALSDLEKAKGYKEIQLVRE